MKKYLAIVLVFGIQSVSMGSSSLHDMVVNWINPPGTALAEPLQQQQVQYQQPKQYQQPTQDQQQGQEEQLWQRVQQLSQQVEFLQEQLAMQRYQFLQQQQEVYRLRQELQQRREEEQRQKESSWFQGFNLFRDPFIRTGSVHDLQQRRQRQQEEEQREQQELRLLQAKMPEQANVAAALPASAQSQRRLALLQEPKQ
jgi:peptidoglycan hydrolase CwlO-like protein